MYIAVLPLIEWGGGGGVNCLLFLSVYFCYKTKSMKIGNTIGKVGGGGK